ncbi:MAG: hypothetical protein QOI21_4316 [Actinomycetota bacterium]|nr:hypothetical protein [Actinomycetota bacterium]
MKLKTWQAPAEVKVASGLLLGIALAWILVVLIPVLGAGASTRTFILPVISLVLGALVVAGLVLKMPSARIAGFGVTVLLGLLHALGLLSAELWWVKLFSGLAFAGYIYALVMLNSMPLRRYLLGAAA